MADGWELALPSCDDCRGTGISHLFYGRCWTCCGAGKIPAYRLLLTHVGICTLAEKVAGRHLAIEDIRHAVETPGAFDSGEVTRMRHAVRYVDVLSKNPCGVCRTFQIEERWVGTGFCSEACSRADTRIRTGNAGTVTITGGGGWTSASCGTITGSTT